MDHNNNSLYNGEFQFQFQIENQTPPSPSLSRKLQSSLGMSRCFGTTTDAVAGDSKSQSQPVSPSDLTAGRNKLLRCSSIWIKSRAHELPEIKDKCRNLISRIGRHRRRHSADFRYDALSYYRNFDHGDDHDGNHDEFPFRSFCSRLPPSPPSDREPRSAPASASTTELVSCS